MDAIKSILEHADLAKPYSAREIEQPLYAWWEQQGFFQPRGAEDREPFVIVIPPPNVTGRLHTGHGLTSTIEDILIRWHRMLGDPTLWVPGMDHAGIATQNVVERELAKEGITRQEIGRELFVENVWEWKDRYGGFITDQERKLGASADWTRERFTLDDGLSRAVRVAFKRLYDDGLIYRGEYLVNWCPRCNSVISDIEVDHEERQGSLWYIRYKLAEEGDDDWRLGEGDAPSITVATTRPETLLGDTAVAVHPEDERYQAFIGREVLVPAIGRRIKVIADPTVERGFGTGAVKITPAHDPNDYEMGKRHGLQMINVMNKDATINEQGGPYGGLDRYEARRQLVADLEATGNLVKTEPHTLSIGLCSRCGTVIEPLLSLQWWVRMEPLATPAVAAVREGRIKLVPERFDQIYYQWMENPRDWVISRQLWWGHRVPVWYCDTCGQQTVAVETPQQCAHCGSGTIKQDEDVLDTWFSSGLWPFSTLGWPDDTEDFRRFYPTSVLETGYDILFFWVARMIFMGIYLTGKEPFHTVYLHGLVRDEFNRKMSKSLENTVDPIELGEKYGTDAMRFTFATSSTPGQDFSLQPLRLEAARNFANKLWNATRFVINKLGDLPRDPSSLVTAERLATEPYTLADRWIISRYHRVQMDVDRLLGSFNLGEAGRQIQTFFWEELADWYIEVAKVQLEGDEQRQRLTRTVLYTVLEGSMRLLHPYMPFVTETAWQHLTGGALGKALIIAEYPRGDEGALNAEVERDFAQVQDIVSGIRNARNEMGVEAVRWVEAIIVAGEKAATIEQERASISRLARVSPESLDIVEALAEKPEGATGLVAGTVEVYLPLAGMVDVAKERTRLTTELERAEADIARREAKLANESFTSRAPAKIVQGERDILATVQTTAEKLRTQLAALG
jgi:valyl-tRNA synthetase